MCIKIFKNTYRIQYFIKEIGERTLAVKTLDIAYSSKHFVLVNIKPKTKISRKKYSSTFFKKYLNKETLSIEN